MNLDLIDAALLVGLLLSIAVAVIGLFLIVDSAHEGDEGGAVLGIVIFVTGSLMVAIFGFAMAEMGDVIEFVERTQGANML